MHGLAITVISTVIMHGHSWQSSGISGYCNYLNIQVVIYQYSN